MMAAWVLQWSPVWMAIFMQTWYLSYRIGALVTQVNDNTKRIDTLEQVLHAHLLGGVK